MAIVSLLLSFAAKKIGSIIQAIFGWSVTALFGRLPGTRQVAVSIALLLSIAWPVFVVGVFVPWVAGWAIAFLPVEKWLSPFVLRIVWGALALTAPLIVGGLTRFAAPSTKTGLVGSLLHGYLLSLGFFLAFLITVVTVPLVKLASIVRGWADEHVYVQAREGRYEAVLRELAEACARAGLLPEITDVPVGMSLSTRVLTFFARGTVTPIVAERVRRVRADGLELYLYPSDLLLRGTPEKVSLARAMLTRTDIDKDAFLVGSERGQALQDELGRLLEVIVTHENDGHEIGGTLASRLVEIWNGMNESKLPFDEWVMLESIARRVERRIVRGKVSAKLLPLDREDDELDKIADAANHAGFEGKKENVMSTAGSARTPDQSQAQLEDVSTADLVRDAMDEAKELVRLEVELAREDVKEELRQVQRAAIAFGVAAASSIVVLTLLAVALVLVLGGTALVALAVSGGFLLVAGVAGYLAYGMLPKAPLEKTRKRLRNDVNQLKEHIA